MSTQSSEYSKKVTTQAVTKMMQEGKKISMLTAYDYTMARIVDGAGVDMILVGDSAANVMAGFDTTVPMTLDHMIYHASSVVRGVGRALVLADLPFMSYEVNPEKALENAGRMMKEAGVQGIKLEGGRPVAKTVSKMVGAGIPVMGHLGLTPQSINEFGGYGVRAKDESEAEQLLKDARALEEAGCFSLVMEKIPARLAARVTEEISIPTIGIGAGPDCDGQVLVLQDMVGLNKEFNPKFLRRYADLHSEMNDAIEQYVHDVRSGDFPNENEQY